MTIDYPNSNPFYFLNTNNALGGGIVSNAKVKRKTSSKTQTGNRKTKLKPINSRRSRTLAHERISAPSLQVTLKLTIPQPNHVVFPGSPLNLRDNSQQRRLGETRNPVPSLLENNNPYLRIPGRILRPASRHSKLIHRLANSPILQAETSLVSDEFVSLINKIEGVKGHGREATPREDSRFSSIPGVLSWAHEVGLTNHDSDILKWCGSTKKQEQRTEGSTCTPRLLPQITEPSKSRELPKINYNIPAQKSVSEPTNFPRIRYHIHPATNNVTFKEAMDGIERQEHSEEDPGDPRLCGPSIMQKYDYCDLPFGQAQRLSLVDQQPDHNPAMTLAAACLPQSLQHPSMVDSSSISSYADNNNNARSGSNDSSISSAELQRQAMKPRTAQQRRSEVTAEQLSGMLQSSSIHCVARNTNTPEHGFLHMNTHNSSLTQGLDPKIDSLVRITSKGRPSSSETNHAGSQHLIFKKEQLGLRHDVEGGLAVNPRSSTNSETKQSVNTYRSKTTSMATPQTETGAGEAIKVAESANQNQIPPSTKPSTRPKGNYMNPKGGDGKDNLPNSHAELKQSPQVHHKDPLRKLPGIGNNSHMTSEEGTHANQHKRLGKNALARLGNTSHVKKDKEVTRVNSLHNERTHTTTVTQRKGKRRTSKSMPEVKLFSDSSDAKVSLLKVKSFNSEPKPNPKAAIFHYPTAYKCLTHYQIFDACSKSLKYVDGGELLSVRYENLNTILGTNSLDDRWVIQLSSEAAVAHLTIHGLSINDKYVYVEPYDRVMTLDYSKYLRVKELKAKQAKQDFKFNQTKIKIV